MSIHFAPAKCTSTPIKARRIPVHIMPKLATAIPLCAAVTAITGAIRPKELPK
ncbi:Uncharacterised protein [Chlamydia trachomatis]|nr:Uncharacterised protein [Chlamydia trachomatis]